MPRRYAPASCAIVTPASGSGAVAIGQQLLALHLEQDRRDQQKLRELLDVDGPRLTSQHGDEFVDDRGQLDIEDVEFVTADELQQQFNWAAEGRRRHDEGHTPNTIGPYELDAGPPLRWMDASLFGNPALRCDAHRQLPRRHQAVGGGAGT